MYWKNCCGASHCGKCKYWVCLNVLRTNVLTFTLLKLVPLLTLITGVCSYVQKHVIDALEGFSQFLANEVSKVWNIVFVIVFIFGFLNCNVVLLDANTASFGSTSLSLTASIFTLSTYIGIVIVNCVLCRKILNVYINFLSLSENWDSIAGNDPRNEN